MFVSVFGHFSLTIALPEMCISLHFSISELVPSFSVESSLSVHGRLVPGLLQIPIVILFQELLDLIKTSSPLTCTFLLFITSLLLSGPSPVYMPYRDTLLSSLSFLTSQSPDETPTPNSTSFLFYACT